MTQVTVHVPTVNDDLGDFDRLFRLWSQVNGDSLDVTFDFTTCGFLRQNAVAFLGGLARLIEDRGGRAVFAWSTLRHSIGTNLAQQGFQATFGVGGGPWTGNSIPYREDREENKQSQMDYLKRLWLGRGWLNVSHGLRDAIVGHVWELYSNAFEHAQSPIGLFTCGQRFPKRRELDLTLVDFGVGIPSNVRLFKQIPRLTAESAMRWAFEEGTTIKVSGINRGMGLFLFKQFVRTNQGRLDVFSHDGYARIDSSGETYKTRQVGFEGTLVNIALKCDDKYYCLASELVDEPLF